MNGEPPSDIVRKLNLSQYSDNIEARARDLLLQRVSQNAAATDRLFSMLLLLQAIACVFAALVISPRTWSGDVSSTHVHVGAAIFLGGGTAFVPIMLTLIHPGASLNRYAIAIAQMLHSALIIHLTGGRIESHFHIFGSLAFLAFYRDWKVILLASLVVAVDHLTRAFWWPQSVFGVLTSAPLRAVEHIGWVLFEDAVLLLAIRRGNQEMNEISRQTARLEIVNSVIEETVHRRTEELEEANTALSKANTELAEEESRVRIFAQLVQSVTDYAILMLDTEGNVKTWNTGAANLKGYQEDEILGKHFSCFYPPDKATDGSCERILETAEKQGFEEDEGWRIKKDGSKFWANVVITPIRDRKGELVGFAKVTRDLTARRRQEQEMERTVEELRHAKSAAEAASRAKTEFLANMSHEIRTPMNGVIGLTDVLLTTSLTPQQRSYQETVKESANALLIILNDILDISKIEAGKLDFESVPLDLKSVVAKGMRTLSTKAANKGLELVFWANPNLPTWIEGDPIRIRQILLNLVSNAVKFTERGEVEVRIDGNIIDDHQVRVSISVRDTGIGIRPEVRDEIFESFTQASMTTTRNYGGTGLGLTICSRLARMMGGTLQLSSEVNKGSTFTFTANFSRCGGLQSPAYRTPTISLADLSILTIDDNETSLATIDEVLTDSGATVTTADSGQAGVETALRQAKVLDLIVLDYMMPTMDGIDVASRLFADKRTSDIPILMLSSAPFLDSERAPNPANVREIIVKPVSSEELLHAIESTLQVRSPPRAERHGSGFPTTDLVPAQPGAMAVRDDQRKRVLLVDDSEINLVVGVAQLSRRGHDLVVARSGREAVQMSARQSQFDVILMDIEMPEMDGIEAAEAIRAIESKTGARTKIVALTAHALRGDREKYLDTGFDDYLPKPFSPTELFAVVENGEREETFAHPETANPIHVESSGDEPIANLEKLADAFGGWEAVGEVLNVIRPELRHRINEIKRSIESSDLDTIKLNAHSLKSMGRHVACEPLSASAFQLEQAILNKSTDDLQPLIQQVLSHAERVSEYLDQLNPEEFPAG